MGSVGQMSLYALGTLAALLAAAGGFILKTQPWYTVHWGYMNPIVGFYFLALAVAPAWAAINQIRRAG